MQQNCLLVVRRSTLIMRQEHCREIGSNGKWCYGLSSKGRGYLASSHSMRYKEISALSCCHIVARGRFTTCSQVPRKADIESRTFHVPCCPIGVTGHSTCDKWCNLMARTSDYWRTTGFSNYMNNILVEVSLMHGCSEAFVRCTKFPSYLRISSLLFGWIEHGQRKTGLTSRYRPSREAQVSVHRV